jgi:hypothetical protein
MPSPYYEPQGLDQTASSNRCELSTPFGKQISWNLHWRQTVGEGDCGKVSMGKGIFSSTLLQQAYISLVCSWIFAMNAS